MRTILVINIALLLLLSAFTSSVYDMDFYSAQYKENGVYEKFGKEKIDTITQEMFKFLRGNGELDAEFFNEKELRHMDDVKGLFSMVKVLNIILLLTFILLLYFLFKKHPLTEMYKIFFWVGVSIAATVLIMFALSPFFDKIFLMFHKVSFSNNDWLLNPATDNLIVMFPQVFFLAITTKVIVSWLINGVLFFLMAMMIRYHKKLFKPKRTHKRR